MATQPVIVNLSGTTWTLNVAAAELDADTSVKDFVVFFNSIQQSNNLFTKLTAANIQYTGPNMSALVEVRRETDVAPYQLVNYRAPILSEDYNNNLRKISRKLEELVKYPPGFANVPAISSSPYSVNWSGDAINAPSRSAVYAEVESVKTSYTAADAALTASINTKAPLDSPNLTGNPTAPTQSTQDASAKLATTEFVSNALTPYATTASVNSALVPYAPKDSPALTGNVTAPTQALGSNNTSVATTAFVQQTLNKTVARQIVGSFTTTGSQNSFTITAPAHLSGCQRWGIDWALNGNYTNNANSLIYMRVNGLSATGNYRSVGLFVDSQQPPLAPAPFDWSNTFSNTLIVLARCSSTGQNLANGTGGFVNFIGNCWQAQGIRHIANIRLCDLIYQAGYVPITSTGLNYVTFQSYSVDSTSNIPFPSGFTATVWCESIV
jgi:hypothetical protein